MHSIEAAVDQIDQMTGPPSRTVRRLRPSQQVQRPSQIKQFQRLKRQAPDTATQGVDHAEDDDAVEELRYSSLQKICKEAVTINTATQSGEKAFIEHACTFVEALGLCFDDCYDESSRSPGAPAFEQGVTIVMQVTLLLASPANYA